MIGILKGLIERFHVDKTILKGDLRDIILILIQSLIDRILQANGSNIFFDAHPKIFLKRFLK